MNGAWVWAQKEGISCQYLINYRPDGVIVLSSMYFINWLWKGD